MASSIPAKAKRVFKGVVFDVYQWEQTMFDGSKETFERLKRPDYVAAIPIYDGRIVVCRESQPDRGAFWGFAGGRLEKGETPLACAKRELLEETGLASDDWEHLFDYRYEGKVFATAHFYVARDCYKASRPTLDAGERITTCRIAFEGFLRLLAREDFRISEFALKVLRWQAVRPRKVEWLRRKMFPVKRKSKGLLRKKLFSKKPRRIAQLGKKLFRK